MTQYYNEIIKTGYNNLEKQRKFYTKMYTEQ